MARSAHVPARHPGPAALRLRDHLTQLAADRHSILAMRQESTAQGHDILSDIIREVEETVLPRRFELVCDEKVQARLIISNRRLIDMTVAGHPVLPAGDGDLPAETSARTYVMALRRLSGDHPHLTLRLAGRSDAVVSGGTACSALHLAGVAAVTSEDNQLERFLESLAPLATGWIACFGGQRKAASGLSSDLIDTLERIAVAFSAHEDARATSRRFDRAGPTCTALPMCEDLQILCARDGADHVLIALLHSEIHSALSDWRKLYRA